MTELAEFGGDGEIEGGRGRKPKVGSEIAGLQIIQRDPFGTKLQDY